MKALGVMAILLGVLLPLVTYTNLWTLPCAVALVASGYYCCRVA